MPISTGNPVAFVIDDEMCEMALERMEERGEISQDDWDFLADNVDFRSIAEGVATEFRIGNWFVENSISFSDVIDEIAVQVREDAAYKKMVAERQNE